MKRIVYLLLMLAPLGAIAQSSISSMSQMEQEFGSEAYAQENLPVFEDRGRQKTSDLFGYMELLATLTGNKRMAKHTVDMVGKLFASDTCRVYAIDDPATSVAVSSILENSALPEFLNPSNKRVDFQGMEPSLQATDDGRFVGILHFTLVDKNATESTSAPLHSVEITVQRATKSFGSQQRPVWEVYLCAIDAPWHQN